MKTRTVTYNLMSFTGFKALLLFSLLVESPKNYTEIKEAFENHPYLNESISIDTLRVYLNSLERIGCKITRTKKAEGSKYVLLSNPFELKITDNQINSLLKIYKAISKNISIEDLLYLENFMLKIATITQNETFAQTFEKYSLLNCFDKEILTTLLEACKRKNNILIKYNSPNSGIKTIEVKPEKLEFNNSKLYLYGISYEYEQSSSFLVSRILDLPISKIKSESITPETVEVIYKTNLPKNKIFIQENEEIISENDETTTIKIKDSNKFFITQRIFSYGDSCTVLEPKNYKEEILKTLQEMREIYGKI